MSINVVEVHDKLKSEHERHKDPAKSNKQRIFSQAPQNLYNNRVAIVETLSRTDVAWNSADINIDRLRHHNELGGSLIGPDEAWIFNDERSLLTVVRFVNVGNQRKLIIRKSDHLVGNSIVSDFYDQVV